MRKSRLLVPAAVLLGRYDKPLVGDSAVSSCYQRFTEDYGTISRLGEVHSELEP